MMVFMDGRKQSVVERAPKPDPIDPNIAAGGLAPCPAARAKIAMLPTASSMPSSGEGLSGIFASKEPNTFAESMARAPPLHGRRSVSSLSVASPNHGDGSHDAPRSASAMEGGDTTPNLPWLSGPPASNMKYKQHTMSEYQRVMQDFQHIKWGGLGADDNDEKKKARETRQRVLEYGKCVSQLNVQVIKQALPESALGAGHHDAPGSKLIPRKLTKEGELARLKRERALRFADQLWVRPDGQPVHGRSSVEPNAPLPSSTSPARRANTNHVMIPGPQLVEELHALEGRHREDYERIVAIKRQLGIQKLALPAIQSQQQDSGETGEGVEQVPPSAGEQPADAGTHSSDNAADSPHSTNAGSGKLPPFLRDDYREDDDDDNDEQRGGSNMFEEQREQLSVGEGHSPPASDRHVEGGSPVNSLKGSSASHSSQHHFPQSVSGNGAAAASGSPLDVVEHIDGAATVSAIEGDGDRSRPTSGRPVQQSPRSAPTRDGGAVRTPSASSHRSGGGDNDDVERLSVDAPNDGTDDNDVNGITAAASVPQFTESSPRHDNTSRPNSTTASPHPHPHDDDGEQHPHPLQGSASPLAALSRQTSSQQQLAVDDSDADLSVAHKI